MQMRWDRMDSDSCHSSLMFLNFLYKDRTVILTRLGALVATQPVQFNYNYRVVTQPGWQLVQPDVTQARVTRLLQKGSLPKTTVTQTWGTLLFLHLPNLFMHKILVLGRGAVKLLWPETTCQSSSSESSKFRVQKSVESSSKHIFSA